MLTFVDLVHAPACTRTLGTRPERALIQGHHFVPCPPPKLIQCLVLFKTANNEKGQKSKRQAIEGCSRQQSSRTQLFACKAAPCRAKWTWAAPVQVRPSVAAFLRTSFRAVCCLSQQNQYSPTPGLDLLGSTLCGNPSCGSHSLDTSSAGA